MKNEVFARAMTEIDEELIASAHKSIVQRPKRKKRLLAAACFLFICGMALYFVNSGRIEIFVYGHTISNQPVPIEPSASMSPNLRHTFPDRLTIPIEIRARRRLDIKADDTVIEVYSLKTDKLLYEGKAGKAAGPVNVLWIIEAPNPHQTYQLWLNNDAVVLQLSYNQEADKWILNKQ